MQWVWQERLVRLRNPWGSKAPVREYVSTRGRIRCVPAMPSGLRLAPARKAAGPRRSRHMASVPRRAVPGLCRKPQCYDPKPYTLNAKP
jgi:hypothetical protein